MAAPMISRRRFSLVAGAVLIAPPLFAAEASAKATPGLPPHDRKAAKAEFARIVAMFNQGDAQAFLAYGPPGVISYDAPVVDGEKTKLARDQIPEFLNDRATNGGRRDEVPVRIDSFTRMKRVLSRVVYSASLTRSVFSEEFCEVDGECRPAGYGPMFEFWRVYFDGPRIQLLEQVLVMS
jgi:hypothetical protein